MISNEILIQLCKEKVCGVLATVIFCDGLGPAQEGDCLFWANGTLVAGTVGGGANEQQVLQACAELDDKQKVVEVNSLLPGLLPSCGGMLQVRLDRLDLAENEDVAFLQKQQKAVSLSRLILFGAGHVVQELAWLADRNSFCCTVVDPRRELLISDNFPVTANLVCRSAREWLREGDVAVDDFIVIAGPDHATDLTVLELVAETHAHYIGVMGSKRKIGSFTEVLQKKSLYQSLEGRLFAPIGIDISSKRPSEVAVSIVAELISTRANSKVLAPVINSKPVLSIVPP